MTEQRYRNTFEYAFMLGEGDLMKQLGEDDQFGCVTFQQEGVTFSRDLLDSVFELRFLRETIGIPASLLDIGAGYGRLLHRLAQAQPAGWYYGIDAVPLSTYLCDFYLKHRGTQQAITIPLHERGNIYSVDLAVNIYSFSEMPLSAVNFWLSFCADLSIDHFFLVPHAGDLVHGTFLTSEPDGRHLDYLPSFERYGYKLEVQRPKFPDMLTPSLIYGTTYCLFRRG